MTTAPLSHEFSQLLLQWYDQHGRKDLPWQHPRSAYRVWVSEIMLQQTQVKTVIPYFIRFITRFPNTDALAMASEDDVLAHWSGLGYYSRARNMHKTATIIQHEFNGEFPSDLQRLIKLPGIGPSTAAAIASIAFDMPSAILDGNVQRVLSRYFLISGLYKQSIVKQQLWLQANACMPSKRCADYTQAIMDLGATCCTSKNPSCTSCPLQKTCLAKQSNEVSNYPNKNPKKSLPTKQQQFLLIHTSNDLIYLEKRPSPGLWGGLWCLPTIDMNDCPTKHVYETYLLHTQRATELLAMKHSFSHFHLIIKALSLETKTTACPPPTSSTRWFAVNELPLLGLAKPVSVILEFFIKTRRSITDI